MYDSTYFLYDPPKPAAVHKAIAAMANPHFVHNDDDERASACCCPPAPFVSTREDPLVTDVAAVLFADDIIMLIFLYE